MAKFEKIDQCVILMAGLGTRFLPATKAVAKELFPIENKPALMYHLKECLDSGIKRVCIVISKEKSSVIKFLQHNKKLEAQLEKSGKSKYLEELNKLIDNLEISFVYQGNMIGSAGAVYSVKKWSKNKPFGLILGDDLCKADKPVIGQLAKVYEKTGKTVIGAKHFPMEIIHNYSSIVLGKKVADNSSEIKKIIEKPAKGTAPSNLVGLARYIVTPEIFETIKNTQPVKGEYRLTDSFNLLAEKDRCVTCEFDGKYYDCGNKLEYVKCIIEFALEDSEISEKLKDYLKKIK